MKLMLLHKVLGLLGLALGLGLLAGSSAIAQTPRIYPIVDLTNHCLLGAASNGRWLNADTVKASVHRGDRYRIYSLTRNLGLATGTRPEALGPPCPQTQFVELTPSPANGVIAIAAPWNAQPRLPRVESTSQAFYRQATADILRRQGIANPIVSLTQVLRVDLEGDGVNEVLVSAMRYAGGLSPSAQAGDYSLVYLRKVVGGQVQTKILEGEYYPRAVEFGAPSQYKVNALVDTNGDGVLEIVVSGQYYEGSWSSVYRVRGTQVEEVLTCGCGA
jgi:hypothetical protein